LVAVSLLADEPRDSTVTRPAGYGLSTRFKLLLALVIFDALGQEPFGPFQVPSKNGVVHPAVSDQMQTLSRWFDVRAR
jgi:hypothetical protein